MKIWCAALAVGLISTLGEAAVREIQPLDGTWEIKFDAANEGREAEWHKQEVFRSLDGRRSITVPDCWETIEQDYEGAAFYGTGFTVPAEWKGKTVRLQFDAVNYIAEVWLNDYCVGRNEGGYGPFEFRVDDLLKPGEDNFLSLRVVGPIVARDDLVIDGLGKNDAPHWRGAIAGGIWQSVRLVASGPVQIEDVFVIPQLADDTARIQVQFDNTALTSGDQPLRVAIQFDGRTVAEHSESLHLKPGKNSAEWTLEVPEAKYWSPDEPNLYTLTVKAKGSDKETVRFGMRELTIRDKQFVLNGKPIYIKAAFFEGLYPTRLALPDDMEMARREIQLAKDAGFNMIRPWRKPPPPAWLDLADEMGVMVIGGLPIECMRLWPTVTPHMPERIMKEVRTAVLRDRNRACIVQWEMFNEIWRKELKRLKHPASMLARELDPSRLILDESGGFADGASIYLPYQVEPEKFNDIHMYLGAPLSDQTYARMLALGMDTEEMKTLGYDPAALKNKHAHPGLMTIVSEIGYGSIPDVVDNNRRFREKGNPLVPPYRYHQMLEETTRAVLKETGFDAIYPDLQQYCLAQQELHSKANKRMLEAIRSNPYVKGYCVHALTGGDWVLGAGLLDLWRNPKQSYYGTMEANAPRYLALRVMPRNIYADQGANVIVTGINDLEAVDGMLEIEMIDADGTTVSFFKEQVNLKGGINELVHQALDTAELSGAYEACVSLKASDGSVVAENRFSFDVFGKQELAAPAAKVAVLDPENLLKPFLESKEIAYMEFDGDTPVDLPVLIVANAAYTDELKAQFAALEAWVKQGGTAVYLKALLRPGDAAWPDKKVGADAGYWSVKVLPEEVLPVHTKKMHGLGLWIGVSHIVTDHPVFDGLQVNTMMAEQYENVWSPHSLQNVDGELIVGAVTYGFHASDWTKQGYLGPEPAMYGMDMGVVKYGEGRYVLNTLRLIKHLGADPVADRILLNLIEWTTAR
jgi:hypothetical protein